MGFHWTPCTGAASALAPIAAAIALLAIAPQLPAMVAVLVNGLIICCWILAGGLVLSSVVMFLLMRFLMPRSLWVKPGGNYVSLQVVEAHNGQAEIRPGRRILPRRRREIPNSRYIAVLPRNAYEWQEDRQQQLSTWRYPDSAGR